jgi:hypothetical protein
MQAANYSVDRDQQKASPAEAAKALAKTLDGQILPSR